MMRASGRPLSLSLPHRSPDDPFRTTLAAIEQANADGLEMRAVVAPRAIGVLVDPLGSINPWAGSATFQSAPDLADADVKRRILAEVDEAGGVRFPLERVFELGDPPDYEPDPSTSIATRAARERDAGRALVRRAAARARVHAGAQLLRRQLRRRRRDAGAPAQRARPRRRRRPRRARSPTPASRPRCSPTGHATARGASSSTCRGSSPARAVARRRRSASSTAGSSHPGTRRTSTSSTSIGSTPNLRASSPTSRPAVVACCRMPRATSTRS